MINTRERSQWVADVGDFLSKFHQSARHTPGWPDQETMNLRASLIKEEYNELTDAWMRLDLPETVDAILDLVYVLIGALPALGVEADPIWDAIHAANMAKVGGARRDDGKILKPEGWTPPDVAGLLDEQKDHDHKTGVQNALDEFNRKGL